MSIDNQIYHEKTKHLIRDVDESKPKRKLYRLKSKTFYFT